MKKTEIYKPGYKVKPLSRKNIKKVISLFCSKYALNTPLDLEYIFEFVLLKLGYSRQLVESSELPKGVEAQCDFTNKIISVSRSSYESKEWDPRFRFTLAHELSHAILHTSQFEKETAFIAARTINVAKCKPYESSEWQADTAAAYLLMPDDIVKQIFEETANSVNHDEAAISCMCQRLKVSKAAAERKLNTIKKGADFMQNTTP